VYANRFAGERRFNPAGLVAAVGINAGVVAALMIAVPHVVQTLDDPPLITENIPIAPPPPPPEPEQQPRTAARPERIETVPPVVPRPAESGPVVFFDPTPPIPAPTGIAEATGSGPGIAIGPPAPPAPVIVAPGLDPRYAGDLQPDYPAAERRMGNPGKVTVRVLIGTDGRVKEVEPVSATSDAFFRATRDQALRRWRFRPGTRDGVPQAAWRTMSVTFVMED
jgi:protein TonB